AGGGEGGGGRGGAPPHRPDGERDGQPRAPDRRWAHDLHPPGGGRGRGPPVTRPGAAGPDVWVVVPAGGQGVRMGRKKQDIRVGARPVLRRTLDVLEATPRIAGGVVAVAPQDRATRPRRPPPGRQGR